MDDLGECELLRYPLLLKAMEHVLGAVAQLTSGILGNSGQREEGSRQGAVLRTTGIC